MRHPQRLNPAFTLVELLVVVAIITLLIALLVPALRDAKRQAKTVQCLANLRGCGVGFNMYASENNGYIPNMVVAGGFGGWWNWPVFMARGYNMFSNPPAPQVGFDQNTFVPIKMTLCPSNPFYAADVLNNNNIHQGYGLYLQDTGSSHSASYGADRFQQTNSIDGNPCYDAFNNWSSACTWRLITQKPDRVSNSAYYPYVSSPFTSPTVFYPNAQGVQVDAAGTIMLADSWIASEGGVRGHCGGWISEYYPAGFGTVIQTLHGSKLDSANTAFYDGHAETRTAAQIAGATTTAIPFHQFVDADGDYANGFGYFVR